MATRKPITFNIGWEIEAIKGIEKVPDGVISKHDGSVGGEGMEYCLDPELVGDNSRAMNLLRQVVTNPKLRVDKSCGFHVHISVRGLSKEKEKSWAGWMTTLARLTEDEAFKAVPSSRNNNSMCLRLKSTKYSIKNRHYSNSKYDNSDRYFWLNVVEIFRPGGIRTVENRLLGNTHRFIWLQAWTALFIHIARIALDLMDDPSGLQWRVDEINEAYKKLSMYLKNTQNDISTMVKTSFEMAKNTGLVYDSETKYKGLAKFLSMSEHFRKTGRFPTAIRRSVYTKKQVQFEIDKIKQAIQENEERVKTTRYRFRPRPEQYTDQSIYNSAVIQYEA